MDNDGNSRLAGEIRAEIARQRLSGRRVAAMIGKPPSTVGRWVSGETPMTLEEVEAFAKALGVSVVDLVERAYRTPVHTARTGPQGGESAVELPHLDSNQKPTVFSRIAAGRHHVKPPTAPIGLVPAA